MSPGEWGERVQHGPVSVRVYERSDKGRAVYLQWSEAGARKRERAETLSVRDTRGRLVSRLQAQARNEAAEKAREIAEGTARARTGPLTLADGVALAFGPTGCYPPPPEGGRDAHRTEFRRYADDAVRILGGGDILWRDVTPGMVRSVWREVLRQTKGEGGHRKAEKMVVAFYRIAGWLADEYPREQFPRPAKRWKADLRAAWQKHGSGADPQRPRYTAEEIRQLAAALPEADPRLRLAFVLGAPQRGGQMVRAHRSNLDLEAGEHGRLTVPYVSTKKLAPDMDLNAWERAAVDEALGGYLSDLESEHRAGRRKDYPLFPGGKLRKGKVPTDRQDLRPMAPETLRNDMLRDLERLAGVAHVPGRGWHGLRRGFSDLFSGADPRVRKQAQSWAPGSKMDEQVYQDRESEEVRRAAAKLRESVLRPAED